MKIRKLIIFLIILTLAFAVSGCNNTDDVFDERVNGAQEGSNDMQNDLPIVDAIVDESAINEAIELFTQLAREMDAGEQTTTRERMIEIFGIPRIDDENMMEFEVTADFTVFALISDDVVTHITINPVPDYFIDESLDPDYSLLRSYELNSEGLTLEYFEDLMGKRGFMTSYGAGLFSYTWRSSAFVFTVDVDGNNAVNSVFFWDYFEQDSDMDEFFEQSLLVIPDDIRQIMNDLVWEMEDNNGKIYIQRAKEMVDLDYRIYEERISFSIADGVELLLIVEDTGMVEYVFLGWFGNFYLNEALAVGIDVLVDLRDGFSDVTLEEIEELFGSPGTLFHYTFNEFTYAWITPDISVFVIANQNGEIMEFDFRYFVG